MTEAQLVNWCISYLSLKQFMVWRNNTGMFKGNYTDKKGITRNRVIRAGVKGSSDIFAIEPKTGRFIAIECKVGKNKPTPQQEAFLDDVDRHGGLALVIYTPEELETIFP